VLFNEPKMIIVRCP